MVDCKIVVIQVQNLRVIIRNLLAEGIDLHNTFVKYTKYFLNSHITFDVGLAVNDVFQVTAII